MGVTASWHKDEYDALGVPFARARPGARRQHRRLPRAVGGGAGELSLADGQLRRHVLLAAAAPGERIPVWFGGKFTPRQIRRIVEPGRRLDAVRRAAHDVAAESRRDRHAARRFVAAGRDPATLEVCDGLRTLTARSRAAWRWSRPWPKPASTWSASTCGACAGLQTTCWRLVAEVTRRFEEYRALRV